MTDDDDDLFLARFKAILARNKTVHKSPVAEKPVLNNSSVIAKPKLPKKVVVRQAVINKDIQPKITKKPGPKSNHDWVEIQRVYDTGLSYADLKTQFGLNAPTLHKAKLRGLFKPRRMGVHVHGHGKRTRHSVNKYDWAALQVEFDASGMKLLRFANSKNISEDAFFKARARGDFVFNKKKKAIIDWVAVQKVYDEEQISLSLVAKRLDISLHEIREAVKSGIMTSRSKGFLTKNKQKWHDERRAKSAAFKESRKDYLEQARQTKLKKAIEDKEKKAQEDSEFLALYESFGSHNCRLAAHLNVSETAVRKRLKKIEKRRGS